MSIFLIRHAESEANINGKTLSHASIALSENAHKHSVFKSNHISRRQSVTRRCKQSDSIIQTICYQHFIMRKFFTTADLGCHCK